MPRSFTSAADVPPSRPHAPPAHARLARRAPVRRAPADRRRAPSPSRSAGRRRRARRSGITSPVCTPPWRIAERIAARSSRRSRSSSSSRQLAGEPAAARAARARASRRPAGCRRPASAPWSSSRALIGAVPRPTRRAERVAADLGRVRADVREVRLEQRAAEPALVAQREPAAVGELEREAVPVARRGRLVDVDPPGHPEVQPEHRAARLHPEELAAPVAALERRGRQRARDLARRVRAADVGVAVVDGDDLAAEGALDLPARALGLGQLGHEARKGTTARAPHGRRARASAARQLDALRQHPVDDVRREHVLDHHDGGADHAGAVVERRAHDPQRARAERDGALVDDLAHAREQVLVGVGDVAADHDHARVEEVDRRGEHLAELAAGLAHELHRLRAGRRARGGRRRASSAPRCPARAAARPSRRRRRPPRGSRGCRSGRSPRCPGRGCGRCRRPRPGRRGGSGRR